MIEICRDHAANVKRWQDGQMVLRWIAAGMGEAAKQFRRVNGYRRPRRCGRSHGGGRQALWPLRPRIPAPGSLQAMRPRRCL
jgi:hypothetical protein